MKMNDKADMALPLSPQVSQGHGEDHAVMPGEFAGMYQAGFEAGYESGKEAGYRQGLEESIAAVQQGPKNGADTKSAIEGKPAPKVGPRRMLLGMPCARCRVYLVSEETHCPCCKQPVRAA
jgi:hypothetical protein